MLSSANRDTKNEIRIRNNAAALYENFNDLTATVEFSFQLVLICRCEPVQPIPPATKTVTGVATHYLTTSTVSPSYFLHLGFGLLQPVLLEKVLS